MQTQLAPGAQSLVCSSPHHLHFDKANPAKTATHQASTGKVLTGPNFYDPQSESFHEPERTGISYAFSGDGFYESAYYRAIASPQDPACPSAVIQWQHGIFSSSGQAPNTSLVLQPFAVDGRQLLSEPCKHRHGVLTRYGQAETISKLEVYVDGFNHKWRLNLFLGDGVPVNPMWLVSREPQMLPTRTLHSTATVKAKRSVAGGGHTQSKIEMIPRQADGMKLLFDGNGTEAHEGDLHSQAGGSSSSKSRKTDWPKMSLWCGIGMTGLGGIMIIFC